MKLAVLFCLALVHGSLGSSEWGYEGEHGPDHWTELYSVCGGVKQSPINVNTQLAKYYDTMTDFRYHNYDMPNVGLKLKNNGHSAQVDIMSGDLYVSGGGLPENYHLAQFHFHWGHNDDMGSEHTLDGRQFPMEMHLVHYAESRASLSAAADKQRGLAVLGFFFEIGEHNRNYDELITHLKNVTREGTEYILDSFTVQSLLPISFKNYYRYEGSLTTPGCFESVIWTVFSKAIQVSHDQMEEFRHLMSQGHEIVDNFRPTQPLNEREVKTNIRAPNQPLGSQDDDDNSAPTNMVSLLVLAISAVLARMFV